MKKSTMRALAVFFILLVVYHVAIFILPFDKTPVFYLSWAFTLVSMLAQLYVIKTAFGGSSDARSKFYGFPVAKVGIAYLSVQLVLGLGFMGWGLEAPIWLPAVLYVVLLGLAALGFIGTTAARDEIVRQDVQLKRDLSTMRTLQSKVSAFPALTQDLALKKELSAFAELLRYADPVSTEATQELEHRLGACITELELALVRKDTPAAASLIQAAQLVLTERNNLCKLSKST